MPASLYHGLGTSETWSALMEGRSGAAPITHFDASTFATTFACEVKGFDPTLYMDRKEAKRSDLYTQFAVAGAVQAMKDRLSERIELEAKNLYRGQQRK